MFKLKTGIFSESISVDKTTDLASVFSMINEIAAPAYPITMPSVTALAVFQGDGSEPANYTAAIKLYLSEMLLFEIKVPMTISGTRIGSCFVKASGLQILRPGTLRADVFIDNISIGDFSIEVRQVTTPPIQGQGNTQLPSPSGSGLGKI